MLNIKRLFSRKYKVVCLDNMKEYNNDGEGYDKEGADFMKYYLSRLEPASKIKIVSYK